jgi:1-acyl-sn-glycerol-3-phosphate acyltransferase
MARSPTQSRHVTPGRTTHRPRRGPAPTPVAVASLREAKHEPPAEEPSGLLAMIEELVSWLANEGFRRAPTFLRDLEEEAREKIRRAPMELNAYGYDPWGFQTDVACRAMVVSSLIYRYYFRVRTTGIENLPAGPMLLIGNHAGQIALDAAMISVACVLEAEPPRIVRGMGEYWLPRLPLLNVAMVRTGSVVGTPKNCVDLLEHGEAVIAFPEGVRGMNKSFTERYRLQEFGNGFMRLALQANAPIVPVAVVGSEEQAISLGNFKPLARLLRMPAFPLVLNFFPLPTRYHIHFGKPIHFSGDWNDEDRVIGEKVEEVKHAIRTMLDEGLAARRSIFF